MVTRLPRQPDRFMGRYSQNLLPLRGEDESNEAVPGQKNQIEWRPEGVGTTTPRPDRRSPRIHGGMAQSQSFEASLEL